MEDNYDIPADPQMMEWVKSKIVDLGMTDRQMELLWNEEHDKELAKWIVHFDSIIGLFVQICYKKGNKQRAKQKHAEETESETASKKTAHSLLSDDEEEDDDQNKKDEDIVKTQYIHVSTKPDFNHDQALVLYFLRELKVEFTVDNVERKVQYGAIKSNPLHSLLEIMHDKMAPTLLKTQQQWPDSIKKEFSSSIHKFLASLTEASHRIKGQTVLYVPIEDIPSVKEARQNKDLFQRLEAALILWTEQIKEVVQEKEGSEHGDNASPLAEIEYWRLRTKDLRELNKQLESPDIKRIRDVLKTSNYIANFNTLSGEIQQGCDDAMNNLLYLSTLQEPCKKLSKAYAKEIPGLIPEILNMISMIWMMSKSYHTSERITGLLRKVSNEIIHRCCESISLDAIFDGKVQESMKCLDECVSAGHIWKTTCIETFDKLAKHYKEQNFSREFKYDQSSVFAEVDAFVQRCTDLNEVCEAQIQLGAKGSQCPTETGLPAFGGTSGPEITKSLLDIRKQFEQLIYNLRHLDYPILDVKSTKWHDDHGKFKAGIRDLELIMVNVLSSAFGNVRSIEQGIELLEAFSFLAKRDTIKRTVQMKASLLYEKFLIELDDVQAEFERHRKEPIILPHHPQYAGAALWIQRLRDRITKDKDLIDQAYFLPRTENEQANMDEKFFQLNEQTLHKHQDELYARWEKTLDLEDFAAYTNIPIMKRVEGNLVNLNFSLELQSIFEEARFWSKVPGYDPPTKLIEAIGSSSQDDRELRMNMESVNLVVRDYNEIILSMTAQQKRLFRERIRKLDKKIAPGFSNLFWSSKGVIDYFVTDTRKFGSEKRDEILEFNQRITKINEQCQKIANTLLIKIDSKVVYHESSFDNEQSEHRSFVKRQLMYANKEIIQEMKALYDIFKTDLQSNEIKREFWAFVKDIEHDIEDALRTSLKKSLQTLSVLVNEDALKQSESQSPLFLVSVVLTEDDNSGKKRPCLKPSVADLRELVDKNQRELSRSISVVTRLEESLKQIVDEEERVEFEASVDEEIEEENDEEEKARMREEAEARRAEDAKKRRKLRLPNYYETIRKDKIFIDLIFSTMEGMEQADPEVHAYLDKWESQYSQIYVDDKEAFIRRFSIPKDRPSSSFASEIDKYKKLRARIQQEDQTSVCRYLQLDCAPLKNTLVMECIEWHNALLDLLHRNARSDLDSLYELFDTNTKLLTEKPHDRETLAEKLELLSKMKKEIEVLEGEEKSKLEVRFAPIFSHYALLSEHERNLPDEEDDNLNELMNEGMKFAEVVLQAERELMQHREDFKLRLQQELLDFGKSVEKLKSDLDNKGPFKPDVTVKVATDQISDFRKKLSTRNKTQRKLRDGVKLFDMTMKNYKQLKEVDRSLGLLDRIWSLQKDWNKQWDSWKTGQFRDINVEYMETEAGRYISDVGRLGRDIRDWGVWQSFSDELDQFKRTLPLILDLKNPALRPRHWDELRQIIGVEFDEASDEFNLEKIFEYGFESYAEDISALSNSASQELSIEQDLDKIKETWRGLNLTIQPYRVDHLKLVETETIFEALEENQVSLGSMKISPFVSSFLTEVTYWERTLSSMAETIELIIIVQTAWQYLLNIFEVEDIQKQLPTETTLFKKTNNQWKIVMEMLSETRNALKGTQKDGLFSDLQEMNENLEQIQRQLDDYLELKRQEFPRFYFLSDADLLEILGQAKDPHAVQRHLENCFEGISKLRIEKVGSGKHQQYQAKAMISKRGEEIAFVHPVILEGPVEKWLVLVEDAMRMAIRRNLSKCVAVVQIRDRDKWIEEWPGQLLITSSQIYWTRKITEALTKPNPKKQLKSLRKKWNSFLKKYSVKVRSNLSAITRRKLIALITIEVHNRDALDHLYKQNCSSVDDFEWLKQLRFYWSEEKDNCIVHQTSSEIEYDCEYQGNNGRLVITPLTERCYMTLTTAIQLCKGGSPQGPAGTGKTETVKDLGKAVAKNVIVFNCSDGLDYKSMGKFFSGLVQTGAWSCFDEFNRIEIEVLSVVAQQMFKIITAIQAHQTSFLFEGQEISLNPTCGIFVTMNPGYAGRTELPDNLKALLRPISMMVPDSALICEIQLYAQGFDEPKPLAKKIATLYSLMQQQLSKQTHYDFGLRNIIGVLSAAGKLKRSATPQEAAMGGSQFEQILLLTACTDMNLPKFVSQDIPLFEGIMNDLFQDIELPDKNLGALQESIEATLSRNKMQLNKYIIDKSIQLYETKNTRHGVMVVGDTGSGKSTAWQTLKEAMSELSKEGNSNFQKVQTYVINPKSVTNDELYGYYDKSREWQQGILAVSMKNACSDPSPDQKWIIFDGPVDTLWIESMNTVLDDNKVLTLISSERISLDERVSLLFEVQDLDVASPATVSRCGMVFFESSELGWQPLYDTWVTKRLELEVEQGSPGVKELDRMLKQTLREFIEKALKVKADCEEIVKTGEINVVQSLCNLFDSLAHTEYGVNPRDEEDVYIDVIQKYFIFSMIWSIGGIVNEEGRKKIDMLFREFDPQFPSKDTVYEYFIDPKTKLWKPWDDRVNKNWKPQKDVPFYKILVPTVDTTRNAFIIDALIKSKHNMLVLGNTGTGKSAILNYVLGTYDEIKYVVNTINFSARTSSQKLQEIIEVDVEKKSFDTYAPYSGKNLIVFMDDFNMPQKEEFGAQPPLELIRQWIDYGFFYDRKKTSKKFIKQMQLVAAMGPPGGGRTVISPRLQSRFNIINVTFPSNSQLIRIYGTLLNHRFHNLEEVKGLAEQMTQATIDIYNTVEQELLPIPSKSHYVFNLRDLSKVFQGIIEADHEQMDNSLQATRLWVHECYRVFYDRLVDNDDRNWFHNKICEKLSSDFSTKWNNLFKNNTSKKPYPFGNILHGTYQEMEDPNSLLEELLFKLGRYNGELNQRPMDLVLFADAIEHLCRISRIISQPRGHACLIGVGGSGRQSLTRLAAYIAEMKIFTITLTNDYTQRDFHEDLKELMLQTGLKEKDTVFLFNDTQVTDEAFLEDINTLLGSGEVPNLFDEEGMQLIYDECKKDAMEIGGCNDIRADIYKYFIDRSRKHLHVVMCMSPVGSSFRDRIRMYPALVSNTTLDWFSEWPHDALIEVAKKYLVDVKLDGYDIEPEVLLTSIATIFDSIHSSVVVASENMYESQKRKNYVTPTNYLELVTGYISLLEKKRTEIGELRGKLQRGLSTLETAREDVSSMSVILEKQKKEAAKSKSECEALMLKILSEKSVADDKRQQVELDRASIEIKKGKADKMRAEAQADLDKALPALKEAEQALKNLDSKDISEIRAYSNPPKAVETTLCAVMVVLKKKPNFDEAKKVIASPKAFIDSLLNYKKDQMSSKLLTKIGKITSNSNFDPEKVGKVSRAAKGLCQWVIAIEIYGKIFREVKPKQDRLEEAERVLDMNQKKLEQAESQLKELNEKLAELNTLYEEKQTEAEKIRKLKESTEQKLTRAQQLVGGLEGERVRWGNSIEGFSKQLHNLVGDVLISSAFLAYAGPFDSEFRAILMKQWTAEIRKHKIPHSSNLTTVGFLAKPTDVQLWNVQGLPSDNFSIENGTLVTSSDRWPLMIDPQNQANKWIKQYKGDKLVVTNLMQSDLLRTLKNAIKFGQSVLIQDIGEEIDPSLEPILSRAVIKKGNRKILKLGEEELSYSDDFRLYFTTKMPNPHYEPEISTKTTIVNFAVTKPGLEEQLLAIVVKHERPELEQQKQEIVSSVAQGKKTMEELEDEILLLLTTAENLLDDESLVETLNKSKKTSETIKTKMASSIQTEKKIDGLRNQYRAAANQASILYFVLCDLGKIDPMYQFSLDTYIDLFETSIKFSDKPPRQELIQLRVDLLNKYHLYAVYQTTCQGLFEKDKLLFSFQMCIKLQQEKLGKEFNMEEYRFFLRGGQVLDKDTQTPNPCSNWLPEDAWDNIYELDKLPNFHGISQSFEDVGPDWREWYSSPIPEEHHLPSEWQGKLQTYWERMIVVRAARPDRVLIMIKEYIKEHLGDKFIQPPVNEIAQIYLGSSAQTPFIFVLSPGVDPTSGLKKFATDKGVVLNALSLGQGQDTIAKEYINAARQNGEWVFLANCHLMIKWMPELEKIIETFSKDTHEDFRLWLSSKPHPRFPITILQKSRKITTEPPQGLKSNIQRLYHLTNNEALEACSKPIYKRLYYSLTFFHSVLLERCKFGTLGWNIPYDFNDSDFQISDDILKLYLDKYEDIPWQALRFLIGDVSYGGRVSDDNDRRVLSVYAKQYFNEEIAEVQEYKLADDKRYFIPKDGRYEVYIKAIHQLSSDDPPIAFGQHSNADISSQIFNSTRLLENMLGLTAQSSVAAGAKQKSPDEIVIETANDILSNRLPQPLDTSVAESAGINALTTILVQESQRYNKLLAVVKKSLQDLILSIRGQVVMTKELEDVFNAIFDGRVPDMWKYAYPSLKLLASWIRDFQMRFEQLNEWCKGDPPVIFWLSGFTFPSGFLTALKQMTARSKKISIDEFSFEFVVMTPEQCHHRPKEGAYIKGLFLEGAGWDTENSCLGEPNPMELTVQMPIIWFRPIQKKKSPKDVYQCPLYSYPVRRGNGQNGPSYILNVDLKCGTGNVEHWIKRGTALLLSE